MVPEAPTTPSETSGRPPRLAKKMEVEQAQSVAPAAPVAVSGRPPRLEKQVAPQPAIESPGPVVAVEAGLDVTTPSRTFPSRQKAKPIAVKAAKAKAAATLSTKPVPQPKREETSPHRKRKLRGIRIKIMNDDTGEK